MIIIIKNISISILYFRILFLKNKNENNNNIQKEKDQKRFQKLESFFFVFSLFCLLKYFLKSSVTNIHIENGIRFKI